MPTNDWPTGQFTGPLLPRRRAISLLVSTAALTAAGCSVSNKSATTSTSRARGGTLHVALDKAPTSLDPANMEQSTSPYAQPAYDALIKVAEDGSLQPGLATAWRFTDNQNKVFEITLRDSVTFSDGSSLDADALLVHLKYLDKGKSNVASLVNKGTYEKVDSKTVRITWTSPHPLAPRGFTQQWVAGMVISAKAIQENAAGLATQTAGAGPYLLDSSQTVAGSRYVYKARDSYWNPSAIKWDQITITVMSNADQRVNALKTGEVDYAVGDLGSAKSAKAAGLQVLYAPTVFYGLSLLDRAGTLGSPLGDVRVRQAINYALDRDSIATALLGEYGTATEQTVVSSEAGYVESLKGHYAFSLDKAKSLLAEAGYASGFSLNVIASTSSTQATLAQVIVEQLAAVGITIHLDSRPSADYFTAMTSGKFAAAMVGYGSQPMPMEYDGLFGPKATFNPLGSADDVITHAMADGLVASGDAATALYQKVETRLVEQAWFAPAVFAPVFYFARSSMSALTVTQARPQVPLTEIAP